MTVSPSFDTERARQCMVDGQLRPNRVTDPQLLAALRNLPREDFLPPGRAHLAYIDEDVALGGGRVLMEPVAIARLVQLAAPAPGLRALVVGAGSGYGAALLAACGAQVTALEEDPELLVLARQALARHAPKVMLVEGRLAAGWPAGAPYDLVLIEGAVRAIPAAIAAQVKPDGRLVTVLSADGLVRQAVLAEPSAGALRSQPAFDCATPFLPSLLPPPAFVF